MEDDDEFGDLYTDVLSPFSSAQASSPSALPPQQPSAPPEPIQRPINLNLHSDGGRFLFEAQPSDSAEKAAAARASTCSSMPDSIAGNDMSSDLRVSEDRDDRLPDRTMKEESVDVKNAKFDVEEGNAGIGDMGSDPVIPGLSGAARPEGSGRADREVDGEGDDWDSDSEDDLQIVLNDNNHGPMAMERGLMGEEDGDDQLVIVADGDASQGVDEQEWGDEAPQSGDGERKEGIEPGKVSGGGSVVGPKIGYSGHGYHPFHSQFKYVRPGAAPMPGAPANGPGGAPGQVRPPVNMGPMPGRGRGDWRPPGMKNASLMQKNFHSGFGMPYNMPGRGFGGLEFTLPSHKTIFEVDIDGFEEKPWKYPSVDVSDFFNFGLTEDSWKEYCKKLEQHRLETTMQSKIRVYESGRTDQDYDPDLPPELAAATGQDVPTDAVNLGKSDGGQNDLPKGAARVRPPIPTGRAIQVESGTGERYPSHETRQMRPRDSDVVIEIVCQDTFEDDSTAGGDAVDQTNNNAQHDDGNHMAEEDVADMGTQHFNGFPEGYNRKGELVSRTECTNSAGKNIPVGDGDSPLPAESSLHHGSATRTQSPIYQSGNLGTLSDERHGKGRFHDSSASLSPGQSRRLSNNQREESYESLEGKSPVPMRDARESSVDSKRVMHARAKGKMTLDTAEDENSLHSIKKQRLGSQVEQKMTEELNDDEDSKVARSSDNSKARSGSSKDNLKWRDGAEEEVIQGGHSGHRKAAKVHLDENDRDLRRRDHDGRTEKSYAVAKNGDDYYPHRESNPNLLNDLNVKGDLFDRRRERDGADGLWLRKDEASLSRKSRTEESRKTERNEEIGSRHRSKVRESEKIERDDVNSRKKVDNSSSKAHHEKDVNSRHRERDENTRGRSEAADGYHGKRRKDNEYLRREQIDKDGTLQSHRESSSRRKRERDEVLDQRRRDEKQRSRDSFDELHSGRNKDEAWSQRERSEKQWERDEWPRLKQPHDENLSKREREEGRGSLRSGRGSEDRAWAGHVREKDDYQTKETLRHGERMKRKDRAEDENVLRHRGRGDVSVRESHLVNEERKPRQEKSSTRSDRVNPSDNQKVHEKKHKESTKKNRELEAGDVSFSGTSKKKEDDLGSHTSELGLKTTNEKKKTPEHDKKHGEDATSDDEQQESRRGRSKLERWTSHRERDYSIGTKSSASLRFKEVDRNDKAVLSESGKVPEEPLQLADAENNQQPPAEDKVVGEQETKDPNVKPADDRHLDTVEKLKKRSERFKLPMPSEKDALAIKKMESEPLPCAKKEAPTDSEIKPERPARKRRWVSN